MSKQLHKNFTDGQVKSLFEKYSKKKLNLIISYKFLEFKEIDSLSYLQNIAKIQTNFLFSIKGIPVIT